MASTTTLIGLGMPPELANAVADGVVSGAATVGGSLTVTGVVNATAAGLRTKQAVNDVHNTTPIISELETAFGTASSVGSGFVGVIKDANADSNCYLVISNGTSYFYLKFTKALA